MDFKTLTDYIFDRLRPYNLARHYAFAEMLYDSEKEQSIPATYCENGEFKHVVDGYDWSEGICYIRMNGQQRSREDESGNVFGCQDMLLTTIPLRLVLIAKRSRYSPIDLANVIASAALGSYDTVATEIGAIYVHAISSSTESDIKQVLEDEFGDIKNIKWDTSLLAISVDIEFEVKGVASCVDPCSNPLPVAARAPIITPNGGQFAGYAEFTMTTTTVGGRIYYTTNGSIPTSQNGTLYDPMNPPVLNSTSTVRARTYADGLLYSSITSAVFTIVPITVEASVPAGQFLYDEMPDVVLISNSETATIYYTTDGSEPTQSSTEFTAPIAGFLANTLLRWRAFDSPAAPSAIGSGQYNIQLLPPIVEPNTGTFISEQYVTFSSPDENHQVWASFNGAPFVDVTDSGETFTETTNYIAECRNPNNVTSEQVIGAITIQVATPTATPSGGSVVSGTEVELECSTPDAVIHFTIDGSTPTSASPVYSTPIEITENVTIKAIGIKTGCLNSDIMTENYAVPFVLWMASVRNASNGRIWQSLNDGATWSELRPLGNTNQLWEAVGGFDSGAAIFAQLGSTLYRSIDKGVNWTTVTSPNDNGFVNASNAAANNNTPLLIQRGNSAVKMLMVGANTNPVQSNLFLSTNSGASFSAINLPPFGQVTYANVLENGWILACAADVATSGVYRTKDDGATWEQVQAPITDRRAFKIFVHGESVFIGLRTTGDSARQVIYSLDNGDTWVQTSTAVQRDVFAFGDNDRVLSLSNYVTIANQSQSQYTEDLFTNNTTVDPFPSTSNALRAISADINGNVLIHDGSRITLSTDNGATYTETQPAGNNNREWYGLAMIGEL